MVIDNDANLMAALILEGGPQAGFLTNPEERDRQNFIEVNGEKLVCIAQGGECRSNPNYYTLGFGDAKSWKTPVIDVDCPNKCPYKVLVCDNHPEDCEGKITPYAQYNKFRGQFESFCGNLDRLSE